MSTAIVTRPGPVDEPPFNMSPVAADVYSRLGGIVAPDPDHGWAAARLIDGLCTMLAELDRANTPDWTTVLNPDRCPWWALRWSAQNYGIRLAPQLAPWERPTAATEERWRQEIRDRTNWRRGTRSVVMAAIAPLLKPSANPKLRERTSTTLPGDQPWRTTLSVPIDDVRDEHIVGTRAASNLVTNPTFTTGVGQWAGRSAVLSQSTLLPATGTHSLRVQSGTHTDPHAWSSIGLHPPGTQLSAGAWVSNEPSAPGPVLVDLRLEQAGLWPEPIGSTSIVLVPGQREFLQLPGKVVPPSPAWNELQADYPTWADVLEDFPTWQALIDGFPTWADVSDIAPRIVLGAPRNPTTGAPLAGRAVYWADPQVNVGATLDQYGNGSVPGWSWAGTPNQSTSSKPDTRTAPILERTFKDALPIGLVGELVHANQATWLAAVGRFGSWSAAVAAAGSWQALITLLSIEDN